MVLLSKEYSLKIILEQRFRPVITDRFSSYFFSDLENSPDLCLDSAGASSKARYVGN
jgi:hypothetical protein